ncbi:MAG: phosphate propanoyltransferase [Oscillospiraceae bacterium]|jgi:putative phosphotransacetylase|nr:phosphate propanoyltransferase [Oscillospiraceae bacterium]
MDVMLEISARHIHLSREDFFNLFSKTEKFEAKKFLSQKGQFLSFLKADVIGLKSILKGVSILGPFRKNTQIEVSLTDSKKLGIDIPIKESGDLIDTPGCILKTEFGEIKINKGLIVAKRHVHLSCESAKKFNLKNGKNVSVKVDSGERSLIFFKTIVRISENFTDAVHIDTDEANAAGIKQDKNYCELII